MKKVKDIPIEIVEPDILRIHKEIESRGEKTHNIIIEKNDDNTIKVRICKCKDNFGNRLHEGQLHEPGCPLR